MTEEQQKAIDTVDRAVIISANAGSGKTSTMVTRLVSIIKNNLCEVSNILALTFTKSASTEMKQRLVDKLQEEIEKDFTLKKQLEKQINELNVADISSLDSFCQKVIKKYFYVINVDPNFAVIDEVESGYLKASALQSTLIEFAEFNEFKDLTQALKDTKKLDNVSKLILEFAEFLFTVVDYKSYLKISTDKNACFNSCTNFMLKRFKDFILHFKEKCQHYYEVIIKNDYELLKTNSQLWLDFCKQFNEFTFEEMAYLKNYPTFLPFSKAKKGREFDELQLQDDLKKDLDDFKDDIEEYLQVFCYGNLEQVKLHYKNSFEYVKFLCKITDDFITKYNELKQSRNVLDFTDLEDFAIKILQNEVVQKELVKQYKFICIDEFQDTNEKQSALLSYICGQDNTFFVGDPKQSIYNFRQCDLKIFVRLIEEFKLDKNKLALSFNQNFRSHKRILQFVNDVFDKIMTKSTTGIDYKNENRFENLKTLRFKMKGKIVKTRKVNYIDRVKVFVLEKKCQPFVIVKGHIIKIAHNVKHCFSLTKGIKPKQSNNEIKQSQEIEVYSVLKNQKNKLQFREKNEGDIATQYITEFFDKKIKIRDLQTKQKRQVKFSDFVILLRSRKNFQMYIDAFKEYNIPVSAKFKLNLIELPHIQMVVNVLNCISNFKQDLPLSTSLKLIGGFTEKELYDIANSVSGDYFYEKIIKLIDGTDEINSTELNKTFNVIRKKLLVFYEKIQKYIIYARNFTVCQLLQKIILENNLINYFLSLEDGQDLVEQLNLFLSKLENKSFNDSLDEFLHFIENYKKAFEVDFSTVSSDNSVKITTIHDSKGLEFPITIVGGCGDAFNLSKKSNFVYSKELNVGCLDVQLENRTKYPTVSNSAIYIQKKVDEILEEMRILYVALTRPKEYLALIGKEITLRGNLDDDYSLLNCRSFFEFILSSY